MRHLAENEHVKKPPGDRHCANPGGFCCFGPDPERFGDLKNTRIRSACHPLYKRGLRAQDRGFPETM